MDFEGNSYDGKCSFFGEVSAVGDFLPLTYSISVMMFDLMRSCTDFLDVDFLFSRLFPRLWVG